LTGPRSRPGRAGRTLVKIFTNFFLTLFADGGKKFLNT